RGMLVYLQDHDRAAWEKLSTEYYFADRSIREPYLAWLSSKKLLRDRYAEAANRVAQAGVPVAAQPQPVNKANGTPVKTPSSAVAGQQLSGVSTGGGALTTYRIFAADAAAWLSYFGRAVDVYRDLVAIFPGEARYSERLADLARSFGQQNDGFYDESALALSHMAEIYPSEHQYRIKAWGGDAERRACKLAGLPWRKRTAARPR